MYQVYDKMTDRFIGVGNKTSEILFHSNNNIAKSYKAKCHAKRLANKLNKLYGINHNFVVITRNN